MIRTIGDSTQWHLDNGDYTHRLNYDLNKNSIVFDLGGYEGWFTEQINNKYGCRIFCFEPIIDFYFSIKHKFKNNDNIIVFPLAISNKNGKDIIYYDDNSSSVCVKTDRPIEINSITLDKIIDEYNIDVIDLLKINIEGMEYFLLDDIITKGLHKKINNIQVQFHIIVDDYDDRYNNIKRELEKTHHLTYKYPYVWENWEINELDK